MQYNDIDVLMKDFNAGSIGKLYCLLEEANPGNGTRNNNKLKDIITGGRQRIERKSIDPFHVDDAARSSRYHKMCPSTSSEVTAVSS